MRLAPEQRFWSKVEKGEGCWLWVAKNRAGAGYGVFTVGYKKIYAHRYSYELHFGPIPEGMNVCHHCDNPLCVRPSHLFLGTVQDNVADRVSKGRTVVPVGERNPKAKLTDQQVSEIRESNAPQSDLAAKYGVSRVQINRILNRKTRVKI